MVFLHISEESENIIFKIIFPVMIPKTKRINPTRSKSNKLQKP
jgi:hypothetical protein